MKRLLFRWILLAVSVFLASVICRSFGLGFVASVGSVTDAVKLLVGVALLGLLNATLGRILRLLTLPLSCITLGLFSLVVNAVVLLVASGFGLGFQVTDSGSKAFTAALVASILISILNGALQIFLPDDKDE